ncbi:MAG TPA: protein TolR [Spongiibacteraceae bacterium]|jgi:biopolymer transport protein TolR|nr:protein TolR [Spongiibacteraceae bacterium]HUH38952.1 protein TolR [Spongiibacteraceae bacterium]
MARRQQRRKPMSEINVVPYIDVMLVLLVIFMITAPMLMQGVKVDLPKAPAEPVGKQDDEPLIVSIKADGSYYLNIGDQPETAVSLALVEDRVGKIMRRKPETSVLVWGDHRVAYGEVVTLMTVLQGAGAPSVGLVTESPDPRKQ